MESLSWNSYFKTNTTLFVLLYKVTRPFQLPILRVSKSTFTMQKILSPKLFLLKYVARIEVKFTEEKNKKINTHQSHAGTEKCVCVCVHSDIFNLWVMSLIKSLKCPRLILRKFSMILYFYIRKNVP